MSARGGRAPALLRMALAPVTLLACEARGPAPGAVAAAAPPPVGAEVVARLPFDVGDLAWEGAGGERRLLAVGRDGLARVAADGAVALTPLAAGVQDVPRSEPRFVDLDGDGVPEIVCPAEAWVCPLEVLDLSGELLWSIPNGGRASPEGTLWSDFDGDGSTELAVWNGNVRLYSSAGDPLRELPFDGVVSAIPWELDGAGGILAALGDEGVAWIAADGARRFDVELRLRRGFLGLFAGGYADHVERIGDTDRALVGAHAGEQRWFVLGPDLRVVRTIESEEDLQPCAARTGSR